MIRWLYKDKIKKRLARSTKLLQTFLGYLRSLDARSINFKKSQGSGKRQNTGRQRHDFAWMQCFSMEGGRGKTIHGKFRNTSCRECKPIRKGARIVPGGEPRRNCNPSMIRSDESIDPRHETFSNRKESSEFAGVSPYASINLIPLISIEFRDVAAMFDPRATWRNVCFLPICRVYLRICPLCVEHPVFLCICIHSTCFFLSLSCSLNVRL